MVYSQIYVIRGILLPHVQTCDELKLDLGDPESNDPKEVEDSFNLARREILWDYLDKSWPGRKKPSCHPTNCVAFQYPCCSKMTYKYTIFGRCVQFLKRSEQDCEECDDDRWGVCFKCLGQVEGGQIFDVEKIIDSVVEAPSILTIWDKEILERASKFVKDPQLRTYYMLDDCLSCT